MANKEMKTEIHMYCKNREQRKNRYTNKMKHKGDEQHLSKTRKKKREEW